MILPPPLSSLFPYTTLFRSRRAIDDFDCVLGVVTLRRAEDAQPPVPVDEIERLIEERKAARARRDFAAADGIRQDRKSTRLNSSHLGISYAVFCLKKKKDRK